MNSENSEDLVRAIHAGNAAFVLAITGGGASAIAELLRVPGGSRTLLEATVPYAAPSLVSYLRARPEQFCSEHTARAMAMAAYQRGCEYVKPPAAPARRPIGVGCTASLASDRPKHGAHRAHLAWQSAAITAVASIELAKGARTRAEEEHVVAGLLLNLMAESAGIDARLELSLLPGEKVVQHRVEAPAAWQELLAAKASAVCGASVAAPGDEQRQRAIFAGAFAPRHQGHRRLADVASEIVRLPVEYEISVLNVDKPPLDFIEMQRRAEQFGQDETLWFTRAPTFVEKSRIFPGATFLVGADTIVRIADTRYYGHDQRARDAAIAEVEQRGCRFLVFGRLVEEGFQTLGDLALPENVRRLCREVPATAFREDISSTELRRAGQWDGSFPDE